MQELFGALSQLGPFLEKLGVVGVLVFLVYYQYREITRLKAELIGAYKSWTECRLAYERCRGKIELMRVRSDMPVDTELPDLPPVSEVKHD